MPGVGECIYQPSHKLVFIFEIQPLPRYFVKLYQLSVHCWSATDGIVLFCTHFHQNVYGVDFSLRLDLLPFCFKLKIFSAVKVFVAFQLRLRNFLQFILTFIMCVEINKVIHFLVYQSPHDALYLGKALSNA